MQVLILFSKRYAARSYMIQKTTRMAIWSVHWAQEAPRLWQKLAHSSCFHFGKILPTMDAAEVRKVTMVIQFVSNDCVASRLHQIET